MVKANQVFKLCHQFIDFFVKPSKYTIYVVQCK